jgi:hypothetical protein
MGVMLEARDENNTSLPFGCLLTQSVTGEPKMKIQDPISKQTLMKSNAQLRRDDQDAPQPPTIHVVVPDVASSSQTAPPPPQQDAGYAQILVALASLQGGMSFMQLAISSLQQGFTSMQQEVHSVNLRVEQSQLNTQECLKHHHLLCKYLPKQIGKYLYVLIASAQDQNNTIAGKYEIIPTRIDINCI